MELEIINNLNNNLEQNKFLNTTLGKAINSGINIGLRYILPDFVEDQIIEIKDNILNCGLKEGINKTINSAIEIGKSTLGIFTGNFENVSQIQTVIKSGGVLDSISDLLDEILNKLKTSGKIDTNVKKLIKNGKNTILDSIENNLENEIKNQKNKESSLEENINIWKNSYQEKNIEKMEIAYEKIEKIIKELMPIENKINEAKEIATLHNLIKNNNSFEITKEELNLIKNLSL